jgi:hypothetical protein
MMGTRLFPAFLAVAALTLAACDSNAVDPVSSQPSDIAGRVNLLDACGGPETDHGGIAVSLEGTSFSTITAADGSFHFANVPAGTYTFVMRKDGYQTYTQTGLHMQGRGASFDVAMAPLPAWSVRNLATVASAGSDVELRAEPDASNLACRPSPVEYIAYYISEDPNVSNEHFSMVRGLAPVWDAAGTMSLPILPAEFRANGIAPGTRLYAVAYPAIDDGSYLQPPTMKDARRFVGTGHSEVVSFTAP